MVDVRHLCLVAVLTTITAEIMIGMVTLTMDDDGLLFKVMIATMISAVIVVETATKHSGMSIVVNVII